MPARSLLLVVVLSAASVSGCDKSEPSSTSAPSGRAPTFTPATTAPAPAAASATPAAKAQQIFATRCASCHGPEGKGDGPIAASLTPHPRDYSDAAWQKATSDDALEAVIGRGGAAVKKSPMMPPSPDLAADPAAMAAMVKLVRSFGS